MFRLIGSDNFHNKLLFVFWALLVPHTSNIRIHRTVGVPSLGKVGPHGCHLERHVHVGVVEVVGDVVEGVPHEVEFITVSHSRTIFMVNTWSCYSVIFSLKVHHSEN